jgi:hypothetical protein
MLTLLPSLARHVAVFLSYESRYTCARSCVSYFGEVGYDSLLWSFLFKAGTFIVSIFPQIAQTRDLFIPGTYQFFAVTEDVAHPFFLRQIGVQIKIPLS